MGGGIRSRWTLVGPTASGKSQLAVALARSLGDVEIVTADSMQVYKAMDIGTAKPTAGQQGGIPHHLIDLVEVDQDWSLTQWLAMAEEVIAGIEARGNRVLLVGGSGLYVQALVDGLVPPPRYPEVLQELEVNSTPTLYDRLLATDPAACARIEPGNRRRILRALEVSIGSSRPFSSWGPGLHRTPGSDWIRAGLWVPRAVGRQRITERFSSMLEAGLLDEVEVLRPRLSKTAAQALGYKEMLGFLAGLEDLEQATQRAVSRTIAFARRQRMWWKRDRSITWFGSSENPLEVLPAILGDWKQR